MKVIATIATILLCCSLSGQRYELKGFVIGVGASGIVQQSGFNNTDFTGITTWHYKSRMQWSGDVRTKYYTGSRWQFGLAVGAREAGWNKINDFPSMEPHWNLIRYSFLYTYADLSAGRTLFRGLPQLNWNIGIIQHYNIRRTQTLMFVDGSTVDSQSEIVPEKSVTCGYVGAEYRLALLGSLVVTMDYKFQFGFNKFQERIIRNMQIHHAVGLNLYFGI